MLYQYKIYDEYNQIAFNGIIEDSKKQLKKDTSKRIPYEALLLLPLVLKSINPAVGYNYKQYNTTKALYEASRVSKQFYIANTQKRQIKIENLGLKQYLNYNPDNKHDGVGGFSGFIEKEATYIFHAGYLGLMERAGIDRGRFVAVLDENTTKVCRSLDNQVFFLNKMNEYYKYDDEIKDLVLTKTFGLQYGVNMPPIAPPEHPCRSTFIAMR